MNEFNTIRADRAGRIESRDHATQRAEGGSIAAPMPELPHPSGPIATPMQTIDGLRGVQSELSAALASGDPQVLMAAVATVLRRNQMDTAQSSAQLNDQARDAQIRRQMEAMQRAQEAERNAGIWSTLARIGMYIAAAASAVVGVAGAAFSGGVSAAGGVALTAALIAAAATLTTMALQDANVFQGEPPRWLSIAIAITALIGSVCSLGASSANAVVLVGGAVSATAQAVQIAADVGVEAGWWDEPPPEFRYACMGASLAGAATSVVGAFAGGAGGLASAGQAAARAGARSMDPALRSALATLKTTATVIQGAGQALQGGAGIGTAVYHREADGARIDAARARAQVRQLNDAIEDVIEAMREVMQAYRRSMQRASAMGQEIAAGRSTILSNLRPA